MLPQYASPSRRRRPGRALINLGAMRRRIGEHPRVVQCGLPAVGLFFFAMVVRSFFSEVEGLPQTENQGLHQAGSPAAHSVFYNHQHEELEDWTAEKIDPPSSLPAVAVATAAVVAVKPGAQAAAAAAAATTTVDGVVDTSTLVDDHPWLVETGEKVATDLNEDAQALAKVEQRLIGAPLNAEAAKLAAEEQALMDSAKSTLAAEESAVVADTELVEAKVEGVLEEAEQAMAPFEKEVTTVVREVEEEAGLVEAKVSGAAANGAAEMKVVESAAEEEVIVIVGTMEEMLFSWTFFGVFLFSLYRVSRKERKWWRESSGRAHVGGDRDEEDGRRAGSPYALRYPREKLLNAGSEGSSVTPSSSLFLDGEHGDGKGRGAAYELDEEDRAALELGRLMLQEREAAQRMREQTAQAVAAQRAFNVDLNAALKEPSSAAVH